MKRTVTIKLDVTTNLDAVDLERRLESFMDPERLASELLGAEWVRFRRTEIAVSGERLGSGDGLRWPRGTRVIFQKKGKRAALGTLVEDCKLWFSFATVQLDGEADAVSVWAGDVSEVAA